MKSTVSVIIPVYNSALYLKECLDSVIAQTYNEIEILVLNDGSTDESQEIIDKYVKQEKRIKSHSHKNQGLGFTRNRGIELSKGKYIFFLDSDDVIPKKTIERLVDAIEINTSDYSVGKVIRFNSQRRYLPIRHVEFKLYNNNGLTNSKQNPELIQDSIACNKLWRKSFIFGNELKFNEGKYYEDLSMTLKAAVLADKIEVISDIVYHWRVREEKHQPSITQMQMSLQNTRDRLKALLENRIWLIEKKMDKKIIEEHDLKSLIDVLRLHASKYALLEPKEENMWKEEISDFLKQIPEDTVHRLKEKEKLIYFLLKNKHYHDLNLLSKSFLNIETQPIVMQKEGKFLVEGKNDTYDITPMLKPVAVAQQFIDNPGRLIIEGTILIPKLQDKIKARIYLCNRRTKEILQEEVISEMHALNSDDIYPFQNQSFSVGIDMKILEKTIKNNGITDLYFSLVDFPNYPPARVRIDLNDKEYFRFRRKNIVAYRTKYTNLSFRLEDGIKVRRLLKSLVEICKKYVTKN